jgi:hypothetical protein
MTQKTAPRIIKKIGESHVVWFGESNRWLELREPAWFVYHKHEAGENEESLVDSCRKDTACPWKKPADFTGR